MKKSLVALAVLAASGAAMAQSSVTLFGIVDAGVTYAKTSGGESNYGVSNSGNATSRLGLRGTEDLGGASGPGFEFKRRSTLSLMGNFGEVRLGRELTAAYNTVSSYDVFGQVGIGQNHSFGKIGDPIRTSNMVSYYTPALSGFKLGVNYGFGEQAGDSSGKRYMGVAAGYENGPLSVGLGLEQQNDPSAAFDKEQSLGLGASYNFGVVKLAGLVRQQRNTPVGGGDKWKMNSASLGVTAPVGAAGEVRAAYNYYDVKSVDGKAHQLSLGYVHNLSKRTALYGTYAFLKNEKNESVSLSTGGLAIDPARAGKNQNAVTVGIRHAF